MYSAARFGRALAKRHKGENLSALGDVMTGSATAAVNKVRQWLGFRS
jgi:hypothetical protein